MGKPVKNNPHQVRICFAKEPIWGERGEREREDTMKVTQTMANIIIFANLGPLSKTS
jgi:hypothetical protein